MSTKRHNLADTKISQPQPSASHDPCWEASPETLSGAIPVARWFDGLPETVGFLSAILFALTTPTFIHFSIESFQRHDVIWFIFFGFPIGPGMLLSILGMMLGFRAYPRGLVAIALLQIPVCATILLVMRWTQFAM